MNGGGSAAGGRRRAAARTYHLDHIGPGAAALAALTAVLWGGNQVAIKVGLEGMPPLAMAAARFGIGWAVVAIAAVVTGRAVALARHELPAILGLGVLFVAQIASLNIGTEHTSASRSTVLISAYPFFTALFAHLFIPGDRLTTRQVSGMVLAFAGIVTMFADSLAWSATGTLLGDSVVLASAAMLGLRQVVIKRLTADLHPYKVLFWQALLSLPVFAALSLWFEADHAYTWSTRAALGVAYQGVVVAGACFIILVFLLSRHSAGRLGVFGFITPGVGVLLSAWITGDAVTPGLLLSMALVGVGIVTSQRVGPRGPRARSGRGAEP